MRKGRQIYWTSQKDAKRKRNKGRKVGRREQGMEGRERGRKERRKGNIMVLGSWIIF